MQSIKKRILFIVTFFIIVFITGLIYLNAYRPSDDCVMQIVSNKGIEINGSDSDILDKDGNKYDRVSYVIKEDEVKKFEIIDYGYDIINKKYFCIADIDVANDKHFFTARIMIILTYDKGWRLEEDIGVLRANFHSIK